MTDRREGHVEPDKAVHPQSQPGPTPDDSATLHADSLSLLDTHNLDVEGHAIAQPAPATLMIVTPEGRPLLAIHGDGRVVCETPEDATEAARLFLDEVQRMTAHAGRVHAYDEAVGQMADPERHAALMRLTFEERHACPVRECTLSAEEHHRLAFGMIAENRALKRRVTEFEHGPRDEDGA